jgi:hypothetical protein
MGIFVAGKAYLAHNVYLSALRNPASSMTSSVLNKIMKIEVRVKQKFRSFTAY